jgi:metacaspase-1
MRLPRGLSLHVGVNEVDAAHYGSKHELAGCVGDAVSLHALASNAGITPLGILVNEQATRSAVETKLREAARELRSGDFFLYTFSGHGAQLPDLNNDEDKDRWDETWCLYDGMMIDDQADALWTLFRRGVRILVQLDCCHAGTAIRVPAAPAAGFHETAALKPRMLNIAQAKRTYERHLASYRGYQQRFAAPVGGVKQQISASILLMTGCQANQVAMDGWDNGAFTAQLLKVWNGGSFAGDYVKFSREVVEGMPYTQSPNFYKLGHPDPAFSAERPFAV